MGSRGVPGESSPEFAQALRELRTVRLRPEIRLTEGTAPQRIAPNAVALTAEVVTVGSDDELASGRFVLLHDPAAPEPWEGVWRAVTFARAEMEPELGADPMLGAVGWSWLTDALRAQDAHYTAPAGTVTRVVSESFAGLAERTATVEMEVRASWTPVAAGLRLPGASTALAPHLCAWADLLCTIAGLPPLPEGVTALPGPRR